MEFGTKEGEICGRDGCKGKICESYPEELSGCSCHINAPCSKCTFDPACCDVCDWEPEYQP